MANVSSSNGLEKRPKLRFPGFDEPWNETALEDLGNFYNGLSGKGKSDFGKGADCYITYMNVYKNVIADVNGCDVVSIEEGEHQNRVNFGDLLFTQSSETLEEVGLTSVWLNDDTPLLNSFCFGFHFDSSSLINPRFAAYSMRTPYARKRITREGQGATRYNLSSNRLKKVKILYPSHSEQDKIAGLLSLLETRIEKQCEIIDQFKKYKRGVMKSIFRDKTILFSETTKWKSVCLGDECTFFSGGTPKSTDSSFYGGSIPFIRSGEIHNEKTELFLTKEGLKCSSAKMISKGDLIVALYGATSGEVDISKIDGAINQAILCIRPTQINRTFLKYLLEDRKDDILNTYLQGGQGNLSAEIIKNLVFDVPDDQSQLKAVDFLSLIDERINSSLKYIEALTELYSGFMQQLFI